MNYAALHAQQHPATGPSRTFRLTTVSLTTVVVSFSATTATVVLMGAAHATESSKSLCLCSEADHMQDLLLSEDLKAKSTSRQEIPSSRDQKQAENDFQQKSAALWRALAELMQNWLSFTGLVLMTFVSTVLERTLVAGQVQQIMQLPGQMPFEQMLTHVGTVLGLKAIHLIAEGLRTGLSARLGAKLDAAARHIDPSCGSSGTRVVVVEAAPKIVVETSYALVGACAALLTSPVLASFYVTHEVLMGQLVALGAATLGSRRDCKFQLFNEIRGLFSFSPETSLRLIDADVSFHDAQNCVDRFVDAGQFIVVASFAVSSAALIEKRLLDVQTFQKVMVFASTTMNSVSEMVLAFDRLDVGTQHIARLLAIEVGGGNSADSSFHGVPTSTTVPGRRDDISVADLTKAKRHQADKRV
eukprot:CAMPEP_0118891606 /NCGR_PEP_ID=MMETSP1166-20130328/1555_1 /TAXON_ID=1104430 /ORGANISM="Chrysoreinhardia sp, Strain CCMP3193" /LENGTH=414 /DNA_ID=CAMNT_0006830275 /DNA_START=105 /DNA_END=1350 /DNA_ORIENTATION=+